MGVAMHAKSDSETSIDASSPPRSPRRPLYYVQSPSHSHHHDVEKMSYASSPFASPSHPQYHCSPIHHSRESSTSLKHPAAWKRLQQQRRHSDDVDDEEDEDEEVGPGGRGSAMRFYLVCFVLSFMVLFTVFSLILWAASAPYQPQILVKGMVFQSFNVQAGMDVTGVPTDMLNLNSTVRVFYRNPGTFFGVHVTSTPIEIHYYQLKVATGYINKFYQSRKSQRVVVTVVLGNQVPLYGGIPLLSGAKDHLESVSVPLNLTFVMRSRAYILGRLVKPEFYRSITCEVTLEGNGLGKRLNLENSCIYKE
ncbi:hypothetical protein Vadar_033844 [Vaccinium darrowii]|uniref:Uncharacterized protein n=1 Tax=Vaccinium darrowii TaxID=229202 RepID=A0ACB7X6K4_9ERIC|nr:hypothetical protein Vadar_033844 [Vaccinium darrowii]